MSGRIFLTTHNPNGSTTEACRGCGWSFTYRGRAHPTQRTDKSTHVCPSPARPGVNP